MAKLYPHLTSVDRTRLVGQFVLGSHNVPIPDGWAVETIGSWTLARHPAMRATRLVDENRRPAGWVLGMAVTSNGELLDDTYAVSGDDGWDAAGEALAGTLTGRFLVILLAGSRPRAYPDPFTMLGAVYAPELGLVASTTSAIPVGRETPFNVPQILAIDIPYTNALYPLGLTPRHGIERVLPNHYLDLSTWRLVRRWPTSDVATTGDPNEALAFVATHISHVIAALAKRFPLQCPLTAGRDSRLLLACARPVTDRMTLFTVRLSGELTGWRDIHVARQIAGRFGIPHEVLDDRGASARDVRAWLERTGGEAGEQRGLRAVRAFRKTARDRLLLDGWGADIVRPIYWKGVRATDRISAQDVLDRCEAPPLPEFLARASRWLEELPTTNPITTMDLLFAEQRGGCWAGVIRYAFESRALGEVPPFAHQGVVRTLMSLPEEYRRQPNFGHDATARLWPELATFPFNEQLELGAVRRRYFEIRERAAQMPERVRNAIDRTKREPAWIGRKILTRLLPSR